MADYGVNPDGPPRLEGMVSLKVDNIPFETTLSDLKPMFEKYGRIGDLYIPREKDKRRARGFAFVRYFSQDDADAAIEHLTGTELGGRQIEVKMAQFDRPQFDRGYLAKREAAERRRERSRGERNGRDDDRDRYHHREQSWERRREGYRRDEYRRGSYGDEVHDSRRHRESSRYSPERRRVYASPPRYRHRSYSPRRMPPPMPPRYVRSPPRYVRSPPRYARTPPRHPMSPAYASHGYSRSPPRQRSYSPRRYY
ncbi:serine/arginine-rich splicing factor 2-like [Sycon ciliatum]|uniref:serine/arginine-rich splicing factor 2-like n=1 Tax=Sycon ciliatum TaxID=27933 RepID=UPI0031F68441